jgi:hypothetical protein
MNDIVEKFNKRNTWPVDAINLVGALCAEIDRINALTEFVIAPHRMVYDIIEKKLDKNGNFPDHWPPDAVDCVDELCERIDDKQSAIENKLRGG